MFITDVFTIYLCLCDKTMSIIGSNAGNTRRISSLGQAGFSVTNARHCFTKCIWQSRLLFCLSRALSSLGLCLPFLVSCLPLTLQLETSAIRFSHWQVSQLPQTSAQTRLESIQTSCSSWKARYDKNLHDALLWTFCRRQRVQIPLCLKKQARCPCL